MGSATVLAPSNTTSKEDTVNKIDTDNIIGNHINSAINEVETAIGRLYHLIGSYNNDLDQHDYESFQKAVGLLGTGADILITAQNYPIHTVSDNPDNYVYPAPDDDDDDTDPDSDDDDDDIYLDDTNDEPDPIVWTACSMCGDPVRKPEKFCSTYCRENHYGNIAAISGPNPQF